MITLTCTNCQTTLTIDDAFAGGVCRCQHCGTIQTVPKKAALAAGTAGPTKALYQHRATRSDGTGLEQLADVVASSGLSNSGLSSAPRTAQSAPLSAKRTFILLGIVAAVVVALLAVIVVLMVSGTHTPPTSIDPSLQPAPSAGAPQLTAEPAFAGIPLTGQTVIFVLDRGQATQQGFGDLKEAALAAAARLGPSRRFQIILWNNGSDFAFPATSPLYANKQTIDSARQALDDTVAFGQSNAQSALEHAFRSNPDEIVLATSKGWDLDKSFTEMVLQIRKTSPAKIHTVALGRNSGSEALKSIASRTNGQYVEITEHDLRETLR